MQHCHLCDDLHSETDLPYCSSCQDALEDVTDGDTDADDDVAYHVGAYRRLCAARDAKPTTTDPRAPIRVCPICHNPLEREGITGEWRCPAEEAAWHAQREETYLERCHQTADHDDALTFHHGEFA